MALIEKRCVKVCFKIVSISTSGQEVNNYCKIQKKIENFLWKHREVSVLYYKQK